MAATSSRTRPAYFQNVLFLSSNWLALQGFGGVPAVVQRELVKEKALADA